MFSKDEWTQLEFLKNKKELEKNGIKADETSVLVKNFISCYCRLNIVDEPAEQWRNAEMKRLASLQELMYYGGI